MRRLVIGIFMLILVLGLFAEVKLDHVASVEIKDSLLVATFKIPEGMHQVLQKDYFYLDTDSLAYVTVEPTVYPEGHEDKDGYINYEGTVQLTNKFTLSEGVKPEDVKFKVYVGYQLCFPSYCEPPVDLETDLPITDLPITDLPLTDLPLIVKPAE